MLQWGISDLPLYELFFPLITMLYFTRSWLWRYKNTHVQASASHFWSLVQKILFVNSTKSAKHATSDGCCGSVVDMALSSSLVCQKITLLLYWKMQYSSKAPGVLRVPVCVGLHISLSLYIYISIFNMLFYMFYNYIFMYFLLVLNLQSKTLLSRGVEHSPSPSRLSPLFKV